MKRTRVVVFSCCVVMLGLVPTWFAAGASMSSEITVTEWDMHEEFPDVAYNSDRDEYFVVWHDDNGIAWSVMGARYEADGTFLAEYVIAYEPDPARSNGTPSVAYDPVNDQYLVVWARDYYGDWNDIDVYGRYVPWNGPDGGHLAFPINGAPGHQIYPRVAYGGTVAEFMVVWWNEEPVGAVDNIKAQRITAGGPAVGGVITVSSHATEERIRPDIAYNQARNEYMVAYQRGQNGNTDIYGVRLRADGVILGGGEVAIADWADPEEFPRIAASRVGDTWAVSWHTQTSPSVERDVYVRTVTVDGTGAFQLSTPVHPGFTTLNDQNADIGAHPNSSNFLVSWQVQYDSLSGDYGIFSQVLNADGTLGAKFRPRQLSGAETTSCYFPAVAGGVDDWMVVWEHKRDASTYIDIHARILYAEIMKDGFETHDTTGWSSTVP